MNSQLVPIVETITSKHDIGSETFNREKCRQLKYEKSFRLGKTHCVYILNVDKLFAAPHVCV